MDFRQSWFANCDYMTTWLSSLLHKWNIYETNGSNAVFVTLKLYKISSEQKFAEQKQYRNEMSVLFSHVEFFFDNALQISI